MKSSRTFLPTLLFLLCAGTVGAEEPTLESLRKDLALRYFEADSHLALVKYQHDHGHRLLAFTISEHVRRRLFEREVFDSAFRQVFLGRARVEHGPGAEARLKAELKKDPESFETVNALANIYLVRSDWAAAEAMIRTECALKPAEYELVATLADVLESQDRRAEAEQVRDAFLERFPESEDTYLHRISQVWGQPLQAEALLKQALKKLPQSGLLFFQQAVLLQKRDELERAAATFARAAELAPDSSHVQGWTGRFFLKVREDEEKALHYYLNAYFLDPHFYDTEHAEWRVRKLNGAAGRRAFQGLSKTAAGIRAALAHENNVTVLFALEHLSENWAPKLQDALLPLLGHDVVRIRWRSMILLAQHGDNSFDRHLKQLLEHRDLRVRGLAAYATVQRWGERSFVHIRSMLRHEAQLIRYDAISALALYGGDAGKEILREHLTREAHSNLKEVIEASLSPETKPTP